MNVQHHSTYQQYQEKNIKKCCFIIIKNNKKCLWNMYAPLMTANSHDLDLWPSDPQVIGVIYCSSIISIPSLKFLGPGIFKLLIRIGLVKVSIFKQSKSRAFKFTVTLTFDTVTSKSIGIIYLSWPIHVWKTQVHAFLS